LDEITTISLGVAEDLGGGLAARTLVDGNACYSEVYAIVTDCRSGEAVAIGGTGGRDSPRQWDSVGRALDEAEVAAASGGPVSVASLSTSSTAAGADQRLVLSARDTIEQGGVQFTLGFACDLLYPDAGTRP
jgi:hypothetical protein